MLKKYLYIVACIAPIVIGYSQEQVISLTREELEAKFLEQNLDLLAQRLEISQAEAQLIQARLWPNPTFEISEVNLWKTTDIEEQPIIFKNWGEAQQISLHLEQEIQTAGKRRKNIALQKLTIEEKEKEFESILREAKLELRKNISQLQLLQKQLNIYNQQIDKTKSLNKAYATQLNHGNISQAEYMRLKAAELQLKKEYFELKKDYEETLKELKNFISISENLTIQISEELSLPVKEVSEMQLQDWVIDAMELRPDVLLSRNLEKQSIKRLEIEKAERVPDFTVAIDYDRGGNIMRDFVGLGLSFDLPIFNRNKGGIKEAKLEIEKTKLETQSKVNEITNEIIEAFRNYNNALSLYQEIDKDYEVQLDKIIEAYFRNFEKRNVSLIEYLDFVEAYLDNKNLILETKKDVIDYFEVLQYAIGKEL
ncbi:TolC family protein [Myroides sp. BIT-d1]|uniref:TolC family protein n=1 Tax=Myroides albus TaxID=2562892 RepID=A0A6I3LI39_9FLAO|nr:TolC family protein [Myroides albus]MTG97464.1 TolC family protein [Myroides albus]